MQNYNFIFCYVITFTVTMRLIKIGLLQIPVQFQTTEVNDWNMLKGREETVF
jgi:hypothetical protein